MNSNEKHEPLSALVLIATPKLADKAAELFQKGNVPVQYEWHAVGTAPSEMIDILGLGSPHKNIFISVLTKNFGNSMLKKLKKELKFGTVNSGIAFTLPITGANSLVVRMLEQLNNDEHVDMAGKEVRTMSETKHSLIAVVVNQGYSENVMEAAREAGAGGGTVVPSRCIANEQATGLWGLGVQDEKDMVFIVTENSHKLKIMQAVGEKCGMHSDAKGIVLSLPIDNVIGFEDEE